MLICEDSLLELQKQPEASVDAVITDPPYGYSFMGKDWDKAVPSVEIWKECLRVLKPGGWCMVMASPRQDVLSRMMLRLDDAGFRTDFTSIYWTYASGFPKASNIGKMVDKRLGAETPQAEAFEGSYGGFQPKPAVEVIIVAMKPLSEKTFVGQALKNGKGVTWMDDCRIPVGDEVVPRMNKSYIMKADNNFGGGHDYRTGKVVCSQEDGEGRFPANLLVSDDVLNDGVSGQSKGHAPKLSKAAPFGSVNDSPHEETYFDDGGSFSRYFDLDAWDKAARDTFPFLIVPKPAKSEKRKGCASVEGEVRFSSQNESGKMLPSAVNEPALVTGNFHPTVKPLKLMRYLITLTTREGDTVLDPFVGSGTTCVAAKQLNREYIGIDIEEDYIKIATARVSAAWRQPSLDSFAHPAIKEAVNG